MSVCVVLLSQPSGRDLDYPLWDVLYLRRMYKEKTEANSKLKENSDSVCVMYAKDGLFGGTYEAM